MTGFRVQLHRIPCSTSRIRCSTSAGSGVQLPPDYAEFRVPRELAFKGGSGDYWGKWKVRVSPRGLSQEDQRRYRMVGVTSSRPTLETSQEFFEWLSGRGRHVVERHIPFVLRHVLLHGAGLYQWAERHPDTEFVPVEGRDGPRLASLQMVRDGQVFLRDARDLATMVTTRDPRVLVAIDRTKEVRRPVSEVLRRLGVPSLREALGQPRHVLSHGTESAAPDDVHQALERLRSPRFQQTFLKGLGGLGIDTGLVWRDWPSRLLRIETVRVADDVVAEYGLRGRSYAVEVDAGLDAESGVCWEETRKPDGTLYRASGEQGDKRRSDRHRDRGKGGSWMRLFFSYWRRVLGGNTKAGRYALSGLRRARR